LIDIGSGTGGTLNSARDITSTAGVGSVAINALVKNITPVDIGSQDPLAEPPPAAPVYVPGPGFGPPGPSLALTALPAQPPGAVSVPETGVPAGTSQLDVNFDPERWVGAETVSEVIPGEETDEDGQTRKTMHFSGGRGLIKEADLGQR